MPSLSKRSINHSLWIFMSFLLPLMPQNYKISYSLNSPHFTPHSLTNITFQMGLLQTFFKNCLSFSLYCAHCKLLSSHTLSCNLLHATLHCYSDIKRHFISVKSIQSTISNRSHPNIFQIGELLGTTLCISSTTSGMDFPFLTKIFFLLHV